MKSGLKNWIFSISQRSDKALLKKIGNSLKRDRDLPVSTVTKKGLRFFKNMMLASFHLRKCDKVGKRPRTRCRPNIENEGCMLIGDDVNINSRNVRTDLVTGTEGMIEIGNEVTINFGVSIVAHKKVKLGNRIRVGPYTMIYDSNLHVQGDRYGWAKGDPVVIEDDVWLASRVLVLKGSLIGEGSVIAAGSVVSGVIPPYVVAGGMPARVIKYLDIPDKVTGLDRRLREKSLGYSPDIAKRVKKICAKIFPDSGKMPFSASPGAIEGWDSFTHVRFICELEKEFNIKFNKQDWSHLSNLEKICKMIQKYISPKANQSVKLNEYMNSNRPGFTRDTPGNRNIYSSD